MALLVLSLAGCSFVYEYELSGTVKTAKDGQPIKDVKVTLKVNGIDYGFAKPLFSAKDGEFDGRFGISDSEFSPNKLPIFTLTLSKAGFVDEEIDISPKKQPGDTDEPRRFIVVAYMRSK